MIKIEISLRVTNTKKADTMMIAEAGIMMIKIEISLRVTNTKKADTMMIAKATLKIHIPRSTMQSNTKVPLKIKRKRNLTTISGQMGIITQMMIIHGQKKILMPTNLIHQKKTTAMMIRNHENLTPTTSSITTMKRNGHNEIAALKKMRNSLPIPVSKETMTTRIITWTTLKATAVETTRSITCLAVTRTRHGVMTMVEITTVIMMVTIVAVVMMMIGIIVAVVMMMTMKDIMTMVIMILTRKKVLSMMMVVMTMVMEIMMMMIVMAMIVVITLRRLWITLRISSILRNLN